MVIPGQIIFMLAIKYLQSSQSVHVDFVFSVVYLTAAFVQVTHSHCFLQVTDNTATKNYFCQEGGKTGKQRGKTRKNSRVCISFYYLNIVFILVVAFSALTLLVGRQEKRPVCKN